MADASNNTSYFATKSETLTIFNRLLDKCIKPHSEEIATIGLAGGIAVAVFEPGLEWLKSLLSWGWDGQSAVFEMPAKIKRNLANADPITFNWINRRWTEGKAIRIFVVIHGGSLLVNFDDENGYALEPGSTDAEIAKTVN